MFNQLTASSGPRIGKKSIYRQFLKKSQLNQEAHSNELQRNQSSLKEKQQKLKHILLSNSLDELQTHNLSQIIKARLRSKQIILPADLTTSNIEGRHIGISQKEEHLSSSHHQERRRRFKTYQSDLIDQSESEENRPYEQAMKEIDELNRLFFRNSRRKAVKHEKYDFSTMKQSPSPQRRLIHLNRGRDFDRYINHLEKLHSYKSEPHHNYLNESPITYLDSPIQRRFPNISPRRQEKIVSPVSRLVPSSSLQPMNNDNFIGILKKVKARGESLLVKLRKFPSYRPK